MPTKSMLDGSGTGLGPWSATVRVDTPFSISVNVPVVPSFPAKKKGITKGPDPPKGLFIAMFISKHEVPAFEQTELPDCSPRSPIPMSGP